MDEPRRARRHWLAAAAALACTGLLQRAALALDAPKGPIVLSVTGALTRSNLDGTAAFDMPLLAALPQHSFSTKTPWYPQPRKFTGVPVRDLLQAVGSTAGTVRAVALNDYRADMPIDDLVDNGAMIAYLLDDQPIPVREKGPLVIIYPFAERADLRDPVHYSRAVWQLRRLELR
jgi:hypothetical protein